MKIIYNKTKKITLIFTFMLLSGNSILIAEDLPEEDILYPLKNHRIVELSNDKTYRLEKANMPLPEVVHPNYSLERNLENKKLTVKKASGEVFYEISIPPIEDLAPQLKRHDIIEAYDQSWVTQSGFVCIQYYGNIVFLYSNIEKKFVMMPSYVKIDNLVHQFYQWREFSNDLFFASFEDKLREHYGIAIYDAKTDKVYKLNVPADLIVGNNDEQAFLTEHDAASAIFEVELLRNDRGKDLDTEVTKNCGYYKILLIP